MKTIIAALVLCVPLVAQKNNDSTSALTGSTQDLSAAAHTLPMISVPNTGALPSSGCKQGEQAFVTGATAGQNLYAVTSSSGCTWTQQSGGGGSGGLAGTVVPYTPNTALTLTCPSATESTVVTFEPTYTTGVFNPLTGATTVTLSGCPGSTSLSAQLNFIFMQVASGTPQASVTMPMGFPACPLSLAFSVPTVCSYTYDGTTGILYNARGQSSLSFPFYYSAAGTALPTCNSGINGATAHVSDANSPTYLATYASGGSTKAAVICNGTNWITD